MHVLVIHEDAPLVMAICDFLETLGLTVSVAHTGTSGLDMAARLRPDVVLVNRALPDVPAGELCIHLREAFAPIPALLFGSPEQARHHPVLRSMAMRAALVSILQPFADSDVAGRMADFLAMRPGSH